jgi:hypothetical protein
LGPCFRDVKLLWTTACTSLCPLIEKTITIGCRCFYPTHSHPVDHKRVTMARRRRKLSLALCFNRGLTSLTICQSKQNFNEADSLSKKLGDVQFVWLGTQFLFSFGIQNKSVERPSCVAFSRTSKRKQWQNRLIRSLSKGFISR